MGSENQNTPAIQKDGHEKEAMVIENEFIPVKSPDVSIREEIEDDGKYVLFNAENELILMINATGKFILESCDGTKNVKEIIDYIEKSFRFVEDIDLTPVVKTFLTTANKTKLISFKEEEN